MRDRWTAGHENDECSLTSDEVNEQLKEGVNGEGLWLMSAFPDFLIPRVCSLHKHPEMGLSKKLLV